jgi:hypothetical protein
MNAATNRQALRTESKQRLDETTSRRRALEAKRADALAKLNALEQELLAARREEEKAKRAAAWTNLKCRLLNAEAAYLRHTESGNAKLAEKAKDKMYALMDQLGMSY